MTVVSSLPHPCTRVTNPAPRVCSMVVLSQGDHRRPSADTQLNARARLELLGEPPCTISQQTSISSLNKSILDSHKGPKTNQPPVFVRVPVVTIIPSTFALAAAVCSGLGRPEGEVVPLMGAVYIGLSRALSAVDEVPNAVLPPSLSKWSPPTDPSIHISHPCTISDGLVSTAPCHMHH